MKKIMIIIPYYFPGYRAGGPPQTIQNVVEAYGDIFEFYIITKDHDLGVTEKYSQIIDGWNEVGKAKVLYLKDHDFTVKKIIQISEKMDNIYACGLFEDTTIKALIAHKIGKLNAKLIVAPMGVFSEKAFSQKKLKKLIFIFSFKALGLLKNVVWSVTSNLEKSQSQKILGNNIECYIASDIPCNPEQINVKQREKRASKINIVFLSRICPQKNLIYAIDILKDIHGDVKFDIYGPKEDKKYWNKCKSELMCLKENISWEYCGEIKGNESLQIFSKYHIFLFPTLGENFGHVIFEALSSGCVPIISNNTIWNDLSQNQCGATIDLQNIDEFKKIVQKYVDMDCNEFDKFSENAKKYASDKYDEIVSTGGYLELFRNDKEEKNG